MQNTQLISTKNEKDPEADDSEEDNFIKKTGTKFVYLIKAGSFYKIGVAFYLKDRVDTLQTGTPQKIKIVLSTRFENYNFLEKTLHTMFKSSRLHGEWYDLTEKDINKIEGIMEYVHFCEVKADFEKHNRIFPHDMTYIKNDIWRDIISSDLLVKTVDEP